jgi:hypothetical protein
MRLANRVLVFALAIFVLAAVASAQTRRFENDPRNQSPSVGTGGPPGGPTGLFTIYDGDTLRRGEFTFSIAYSNYDRDPGDLDIADTVLSVNVGVSNHLELFFNTTAYRGIKANSPLNLSGFYLPNSRVFFSSTLTGSPPAIIIAPGGLGTASGSAIFRPAFCPLCTTATSGATFVYFNGGQPFVAYPFTGGTGPTFGLTAGGVGTPFGFPGFTGTTLGPPIIGSGGNFGGASTYPGVGSPVGGILPGIVLATTRLPATALNLPITVPSVFTTAPSYYPGAPFLNRLYGESSVDDFTAGVKWRLTGPSNPFGFGFIPFYRWYADKPDDASGFNQMQRGAGPGAHLGDIGLIMFASGRLSKSVNLSANLGYILNSNPKGPAGDVLLDRPDEVIAGVGFDFPINKHIQPIAEFRSTQYVGGHTRNAFQNNPIEWLAGVKIYPSRWWGIAGWWRMHLNQQSQSHFNAANASISVSQVTNVNVPGRGLVVVPGTTIATTTGGAPIGFRFSDNPWGYGGQVWFGHRNAREPAILPNQPPVISSFAASASTVTLPCVPPQTSATCPTTANTSLTLTTAATDPDGDTLLYTYSTTGGRITGDGASVTWDLSGVGAGTYTATVEVDDGCGCITTASTTVTVAACADCVTPPPPCPTVSVSCPDTAPPDQPITFTANVSGGPGTQTYNWSVSAGTISSGQGTSSITVTGAPAGGSVTATVELGGIDPSCTRTASCTTQIQAPPRQPTRFDTYGNIRFNDEKARLDNFAIQLQNEPTSQGYIIGYGTCDAEGQTRANRAKDYLVNTRGIDASRLVVVDGGCMPELRVDLWIVPSGATPPAADTTGAVSPCPDCKKPRRRARRGRGEE